MECGSCRKCGAALPENAAFCPQCGERQGKLPQGRKKRGNGQGSAYKLKNGTWIAVRVLGYEVVAEGKTKPIKATRSGFRTKKDALAYLPQLTNAPKKINGNATLKAVYALWLENYQRLGRSRSTENCYKAAFNYFRSVWYMRFADIGIDDLQECVDDCPHGRRTRENMKAVMGLVYKYALPRGYLPERLNLAEFLFVGGAPGAPREAFTAEEIETIRKSIGKVPYADYIYCQIYLGFRPHEFLTLDAAKYNAAERCFVGGRKTEAGTDRSVTVSPRIQKIIDRLLAGRASGPVFCSPDGRLISDKQYREDYFYPALLAMGLPNPAEGPNGPRKLTPHCCRHTFATLMKAVDAPDKDKLELIGHTSPEMLQHYQHTNYNDLRRITDQL